jgi:hypothetical protein
MRRTNGVFSANASVSPHFRHWSAARGEGRSSAQQRFSACIHEVSTSAMSRMRSSTSTSITISRRPVESGSSDKASLARHSGLDRSRSRSDRSSVPEPLPKHARGRPADQDRAAGPRKIMLSIAVDMSTVGSPMIGRRTHSKPTTELTLCQGQAGLKVFPWGNLPQALRVEALGPREAYAGPSVPDAERNAAQCGSVCWVVSLLTGRRAGRRRA